MPISDIDESSVLPVWVTKGHEEKRYEMHWVIGGWVHTHGMDAHGYPEIEVRGVPDFLGESVVALIRHVCNYMLDEEVRIKPGETMEISPRTRFRLIKPDPLPGEEDHYDVERLQIVDVEQVCDCCGQSS
jgi:hypothetical protein